MHVRARVRIEESVGEARALRGEIVAWRSGWEMIDAMGEHFTQLERLCSVVLGLVDEIASRTAAVDPTGGTGPVYEECRAEDLRLLHARRLWRWYADKLDQRAESADSLTVQTLRAANQVVWSCWKTAFTALGERLPAAPIPYLAPQFSASATPRTDPPEGLRPGMDDLLRKHVEQLPVAALALPPVCCRRPWWVILSAHEASHHVQFESPGLEQLAQDQVVGAAYAVTEDVELAEAWRPWCRELFADALSVLLTGPAAIWAVDELETRTAPGMRKSPSGSYPPPLVRLAVLREVARQAGVPSDEADEPATDGDDRLRQLLNCAPDVAAALLGLKSAACKPLHGAGEQAALAYADGGSVGVWAAELLGVADPVPRRTLQAARFCAAGGVQAWQRLVGQTGDQPGGQAMDRLSSRLRDLLPQCGEPGARAEGAGWNAADVARQFASDLYADGKFR